MLSIIEQIKEKNLPVFWQFYLVFLAFMSFSVTFYWSNNIFHSLNIIIHALIIIGIFRGQQFHQKKSILRLLLVNGVVLISIALLMRSFMSFGIFVNIFNITVLIEELGIISIAIFAYIQIYLVEEKFKIKGFVIDYSLVVFSCVFFLFLVSPTLLNTFFYTLNFPQKLDVLNIFVGSMLLSMSMIHYFISRSLGATDTVRILLTLLFIIHFSLDLFLSLNSSETKPYLIGLSWSVYHLAGTLAILFIFIENFSLDFSSMAPLRLGNHFMWVSSIVAILVIPVSLITGSIKDSPLLDPFVIGIFGLCLSAIVIWRFILLIENTTQQRSRLKTLIQTNSITDLPNYQGYLEKVVLSDLQKVLVVAINIEDFRAINDLYGRAVGDGVLKSLGKRLQALPDAFVVAHIHTDLFLVVFKTTELDFESYLQRTQERMGIWDVIDDQKIAVPLTFGATFSKRSVDPEKLAKLAEQALKKARSLHASFFIEIDEIDNSQIPRHELRQILQQAVDENYLPVHFQPIYNLDNGSLKALELLIRVDSKKYGLLQPGQFLEQATTYGLLTSLTKVCVKMVAKHFDSLPETVININLPPYMLKSLTLLNNFIEIFEEEKLPPHRFCIEITEDEYISTNLLIPAIKKLKEYGFSIAMDDFGTGYSSLTRLSVLDVDTVKIDRSLLLSASSGNTAILETAITLAKKLDVSAVVEGVETIEQLALIKLLGADSVQGFLYSKPVSVKQATNIALNSNDIVIA